MVDGSWDGYVVKEILNTQLKDGKVINNKYNGFGTQIIYLDDTFIIKRGNFVNNKLEGECREELLKRGEWKIPHSYTGDYQGDRFHGPGVESLDGYQYRGQWENGSKTG